VTGEVRTGIGYDAHAFQDDSTERRPLVLGGVTVPHDRGLAGWSDADVLLHAIADALLGAAALGDIGRHFPPGEAAWQGVDSRVLLREAAALVRGAGWRVVNVDATVLAEAPRIAPHVPAMAAAIATALGIESGRVGVKATTNEGMGFVGRREGIAAMAVATIASLDEPAAPGGS
jgi:2-C-methyl-D-erythritol 2,4-cyclodiphosphate synthase